MKRVCEKVNRQVGVTVSDSVKDKYILAHLKYKYRHLRSETYYYLTEDEKLQSTMFWTRLRMEVDQKNMVRFEYLKMILREMIASYFYLLKKPCKGF